MDQSGCAAQFVANPETATTDLAGELLAEFARAAAGSKRLPSFPAPILSRYCP